MAANCIFKLVDGVCKCEICGYTIKGNCERIFRNCQNSEMEYPSVLEMTKNAVLAGAKFISKGARFEGEKEQERRMEICNSCPLFDKVQKRCTKCGCYMNFKTMLSSESCPIGKW